MENNEDSRMIGSLVSRVEAIEREQSKMSKRQDDIMTALTNIQSTLDKAAGGATVIRWIMGFLGLGSLSGCIALAAWVGGIFGHK